MLVGQRSLVLHCRLAESVLLGFSLGMLLPLLPHGHARPVQVSSHASGRARCWNALRLLSLLQMLHGCWKALLMFLLGDARPAHLRWRAARKRLHMGRGCLHRERARKQRLGLDCADWHVGIAQAHSLTQC